MSALPGSKSQASVTNSKVMLKSEKLAGRTLPGCNNLQTFKKFQVYIKCTDFQNSVPLH